MLWNCCKSSTDTAGICGIAANLCTNKSAWNSSSSQACLPYVGILNRVKWLQQHWPLEKADIVAFKTSTAFVDHLWEMFGPLLSGENPGSQTQVACQADVYTAILKVLKFPFSWSKIASWLCKVQVSLLQLQMNAQRCSVLQKGKCLHALLFQCFLKTDGVQVHCVLLSVVLCKTQ